MLGVEWRLTLADRRLMVLNVVVPLALVVPLSTGALSPPHAAAAYAVLFTLFCIGGAASELLGDAEAGMTRRVVRGGIGPASYLLQRTFAGAVVDLVQLTPSLALVTLAAGASMGEALAAWGALAAAAWVGGLVGVVSASLSRSALEATLFVSVAVFLLCHLSGVFRAPEPGSLAATFEGAAPFRALHEAFLGIATGAPVRGGTAAVAWSVALPLVVGLFAPALLRSLSHVRQTEVARV